MDATARPTLSADATAADHLMVRIPVASRSSTVGEARRIAAERSDGAHVYIVGEDDELVGLLTVTRLLELGSDEPIGPHIEPAPTPVRCDEDQESVALAAVREGTSSLPVKDERGRFIGIVPAAALLRVLHHEHVEDLDRLAGILRQTEHAARALEEPPSRRVRERLPWLLVGLAGSVVATGIVSAYEDALQRHLAVAFFMPGIVYLADAVGTQTEAIAVRGLSFKHARGWRVLVGELSTGLLLGLVLSLPVLPIVWWVFGDLNLALSVSVALGFACTVATLVGLGFPWVLSRAGKDPALGSGPLATVVQDVLSLLAYFGAVQLLMS